MNHNFNFFLKLTRTRRRPLWPLSTGCPSSKRADNRRESRPLPTPVQPPEPQERAPRSPSTGRPPTTQIDTRRESTPLQTSGPSPSTKEQVQGSLRIEHPAKTRVDSRLRAETPTTPVYWPPPKRREWRSSSTQPWSCTCVLNSRRIIFTCEFLFQTCAQG